MKNFEDRLDDFHKGIISGDIYSRLHGKSVSPWSTVGKIRSKKMVTKGNGRIGMKVKK